MQFLARVERIIAAQASSRRHRFGVPPCVSMRNEFPCSPAVIRPIHAQLARSKTAVLLPLLLLVWSAKSSQSREVTVSSREELTNGLANAKPGDEFKIAPGEYRGGIRVPELAGTAESPITITAQSPDDRPVFLAAEGTGIHLSNCRHVVLSNLVVRRSSVNGINIDDGGKADSPSHHVVLENLWILDTGTKRKPRRDQALRFGSLPGEELSRARLGGLGDRYGGLPSWSDRALRLRGA